MIGYINRNEPNLEVQSIQNSMVPSSQSYQKVNVAPLQLVHSSLPQTQTQIVVQPQSTIPPYPASPINRVQITYPANMGPTALANNLLSMPASHHIYASQGPIIAGSMIQQSPSQLQSAPQNIFKGSYIYNNNIPMNSSSTHSTSSATIYEPNSNQNSNKLSRVLPPINSNGSPAVYTSRTNTNSDVSSVNSGSSTFNVKSISTSTPNDNIQVVPKYSITSQGSVGSCLDGASIAGTPVSSTPLFSTNQSYTTSRASSNQMSAQTSITSIPQESIQPPIIPTIKNVYEASCVPATIVIANQNELDLQNQRRHSVSLAGITNTPDTAPKAVSQYAVPQSVSHGDLRTLVHPDTNNHSRSSSNSPPIIDSIIAGERINERGQLVGKSGKLLRNTKRAAQNRCAQKAFRIRREKYIRDLEEKAKRFDQILQENEMLKKTVRFLKEEKGQLVETHPVEQEVESC